MKFIRMQTGEERIICSVFKMYTYIIFVSVCMCVCTQRRIFPNFIIITDASRLYCSRLLGLCNILLYIHISRHSHPLLSFHFALPCLFIYLFFFLSCSHFSLWHDQNAEISLGIQSLLSFVCYFYISLYYCLRLHAFAQLCETIGYIHTLYISLHSKQCE